MLKEEMPNMTEPKLREHVRRLFREASANGRQLSKWDVYHSKIQLELDDGCQDDELWKWAVSTQEMRDRGETYILPKEITLTPLPKTTEYDPEDMYNLRDDISHPIRPNMTRKPQWFDRPYKHIQDKQSDLMQMSYEKSPSKSANEQFKDSMWKKERREFLYSKSQFERLYEKQD